MVRRPDAGRLINKFLCNKQVWVAVAIFVGWLIKVAVMHWGGYKAYRQLRPFFLGLIIGDVVAGAIWIVVGFATGDGYMVLPG